MPEELRQPTIAQQIEQQKAQLFDAQVKRDRFVLNTQKMTVPPADGGHSGNSDYTIVIGSDADFLIEGITGTYFYYGNNNGVGVVTPSTESDEILIAPAARKVQVLDTTTGDATFVPDVGYGLDDGGIKITDGRNNRLLTDNFVPLSNLLSGGAIGKPMMMVMPFKHFCKANGTLRLELVNYTDKFLRIMIAFHGVKFFL